MRDNFAMKHLSLFLLSLSNCILPLSAKSLVNVDPKGIGIKGYDPVAYFNAGVPTQGSPDLRSTNAGVIYLFSSKENQQLFDNNPKTYSPLFGGFCAYGVSRDSVIPVDPTVFQIVEGQLLLQYSKGVMAKFNKDQEGNLSKATMNWPSLVDRKGR